MVLSLTSTGVEYLPVTASLGGLVFLIYMSFKHRTFVMKAVLTVLRKFTRKR